MLHLNEDLLEVTAVVNPEVGKPVYIQGYSKAINTLSKEGLQMADPNPSDTLQDIQLILGVDYMPLLFKRKVHFLGVELFDTAVGHVVWGQLPQWTREPEPPRAPAISMKQFFANVDTPLEPNVENLWSLESVGITFEEHSHLETKTIQFFKETVRKLPTGYSIKLPFKSSDRPALNYARAIAQLNSLKTKADAKFIFEKYQAILKDYVEQDFIEVVPDGSTPDVCGLVHYLPHHPVYKQSSTTPMRIVFNASAKERKGSLSLNDTLYTGPNLAIKIAKMILAFRSQTFGVLADISKAFLRVRIEETDRDYCRFLFFADEHFSQIVKYRFKRVCFGATSSPYLLNQTIQHHLDTLDTPLTARLKSAFYVDNLQLNYDETACILDEKEEISQVMIQADMPLSQWVTNAPLEHDEFLPKGHHEYLGLTWDTETDSLKIKTPALISSARQDITAFRTKRRIVSLFSSIFDPLGLLAPLAIAGKLLIQQLWRENLGWDTVIPDTLLDELKMAIDAYDDMESLAFPRNAHLGSEHTLHVFCDASRKAFGVAAYAVSKEGHAHLLTAKARITPKNLSGKEEDLTIPKLELTALLFGCRLAVHLKQGRPSDYATTYVWTDARSSIDWVRSQKSPYTYVINRAHEIEELVLQHGLKLMHVERQHNPADLAMQPCTVKALRNPNRLWFTGPSWLHEPEAYPSQATFTLPAFISTCSAFTRAVPYPKFDFQRFKSFTSAFQIIRRILSAWRSKAPASVVRKLHKSPLSCLYRLSQQTSFPALYHHLSGHPIALNDHDRSLLGQRACNLDPHGVIRSQAHRAPKCPASDYIPPVLLDRNSPLWTLIVQHFHVLNAHGNTSLVLATLQKHFWVARMRQSVNHILYQCAHCKLIRAEAYARPPLAELHPNRIDYTVPFAVTGVDYTGAYSLEGDIPRTYILLFTCTATRAVALEAVTSDNLSHFLLGVRRFASRFGMPQQFYSDNGRTFKAGARLLQELASSPQLNTFTAQHGTSWQFITPRAPWQGGVYERMIGIVKNALQKTLFRRRFQFEEFRTFLQEVECIVNNRPITYLPIKDDQYALTPNHLLFGRSLDRLPQTRLVYPDDLDYGPVPRAHIAYQIITDALADYHKRFANEYVNALYNRSITPPKKRTRVPAVDDIVLLALEGLRRHEYPLARILEVFPSPDGHIRSARVQTKGGTYVRSVTKLIPLELHITEPDQTDEPNASPDSLEHLDSRLEQPEPSTSGENARPKTLPVSARGTEEDTSDDEETEAIETRNVSASNEETTSDTLHNPSSEPLSPNEAPVEPLVSQTGRPVRAAAIKQKAFMQTKLPDL